ncbi:MAG: 50S ribosomal protein L25 [Bacteroidota bacterium]
MAEIVLQAEIRHEIGKHAKRVRRAGKVPGIFYAHGQTPIPLTVDERYLRPLIYTSETHIVDLRIPGDTGTHSCILKDVQFDPVTEKVIHFDLLGLKADEEITVEVPVRLVGTPNGVKAGGILQHSLHRVPISCLPKNIPQHIEVNVEQMEIGDSIHAGNLPKGEYRILLSEDATIAAIVPPAIMKEAAPEAAEAPAEEEVKEPEVIGKGKKEEEEEGSKE